MVIPKIKESMGPRHFLAQIHGQLISSHVNKAADFNDYVKYVLTPRIRTDPNPNKKLRLENMMEVAITQ